MPKTIFDRVFEDLQLNHPLLAEIDFINTTGTIEWIMRTAEATGAVWGPLTGKINEELANGFKKKMLHFINYLHLFLYRNQC